MGANQSSGGSNSGGGGGRAGREREAKKCYYEVLGVDRQASEEE